MPTKPKFGSIYKRGGVWWIKYYRDGKPFYESSGSVKSGDAQRLLGQRRAEIFAGTHLGNAARKITISELLDDLVRDYKVNGKDAVWCEGVVRNRLRPYFGAMRATKLTYSDAMLYVEQRQAGDAPNSTINKEVALLRRSYNLAKRAGKVATVPLLPARLTENNVRKGFFEREEFLRLRAALPDEIKPVVTFAYWTGCRRGEILSLRWCQVDLHQGVVRLEPGETKNDEGRLIPLAGELLEMLQMQKDIRDLKWPECPWVFFRTGKPIKTFTGAWTTGCIAAELFQIEGGHEVPTRLFHDLRRTGVRNLVRAGVPERVAMAISGHKTRSVFDRYNIVSERDLHDAARRLNAYVAEAEKIRDGDNVVTVAQNTATLSAGHRAAKLLN
jgi:integrase